ncbi:hypothetical protein CY34DRAFT_295238 [Suillus luteus UH-Slu-Lm8-n1]|uniref:Uncharacterized protein n=1 Tax=Suillus luteus UH-Slu-Lm8-n1 TaxID=930992 RepID=A0A0D0APQ9_9AGAM|nr:hypothetical protein CY34DRAFT_295238 [Suillus luteus UH-Slu-Lm8-n1]
MFLLQTHSSSKWQDSSSFFMRSLPIAGQLGGHAPRATISLGSPRVYPEGIRARLMWSESPSAEPTYHWPTISSKFPDIIEGSASACTSAGINVLAGSVSLSKSFAMCRCCWYGRLGGSHWNHLEVSNCFLSQCYI